MTKKNTSIALLLFLFLLIIGGILKISFNNPESGAINSNSPTPTSIPASIPPANSVDLEFNDNQYSVSWLKVDSADRLFLYPNFADKLSSSEAVSNNNCISLVSAGFYTKEATPIGLFITEGRQLKSKVENTLFNGIFSILYSGESAISGNVSDENTRVALQSGPILMRDGNVDNLSLVNDESARRVVLGITEENDVIFFIFYKKGSVFIGPSLTNLPELVKLASEKAGVQVVDAINLDGGGASAFYTGGIKLSEISPIGSFFCIKN